MKVKTWHLFLIVTVLFIVSFYVVNRRFDKFYRINGINNENRILLETYLSEEEQVFLVDNQISLDLFIDYLEDENFQLHNYRYYNLLKDTKRYSKNEIVELGNNISNKTNEEFKEKGFECAKTIIKQGLEKAYIKKNNFNFDYLKMYKNIKGLYEKDDYIYINHLNDYVKILNSYNITDLNHCSTIIELLSNAFTKETLYDYFHYNYNENVHMIFNPYDLTTIVNSSNYIGAFEPDNLILIQDVPRIRYSMYLQGDAYYGLLNMYNDLKNYYQGFLLKESYISYDKLESGGGFAEAQLGLTIDVTQSETPYDIFEETDISKWLQDNAHKYGYVLRYPKNKETYTHHEYDPHIYRYVGIEHATNIYNQSLSLDEYVETIDTE